MTEPGQQRLIDLFIVHAVPPPVDALSPAGQLFGLQDTSGVAPAPSPAK